MQVCVRGAEVESKAGRVQVSHIQGTAKVKTNAGKIQAKEVGSASLQTDMGRVVVENVKAKLDVKTIAGEVDVKTDFTVSDDWNLQTDMGKISISLPKSSSVKIHAKTDMGSIRGSGSNGNAGNNMNGPNADYKYGGRAVSNQCPNQRRGDLG